MIDLHYKKMGDGPIQLIILHGLFGSSDNWHTLGGRLAEEYTVYLLDQRNHGRSENTDDFSYDLMAKDLANFIEQEQLDNFVIIGHSMGGKTALQYAENYAQEGFNKLIVVDIGIKKYPLHHDQILKGLMAIDPENLESRKEANQIMDEYVPEFMVKQFLLKNLYRKKDGNGYGWRINVPVLNREIHSIIEELKVTTIDTPTLFIRGGKSNYILESDYEDILSHFPKGKIESIEDSGHWIHAESPDQFYDLVVDFIG